MTTRNQQQNDTNVFEAAEQREDGWHVGVHGPFSNIYDARKTSDATCVIVGSYESKSHHVIIDGVLRDSFVQCEIVQTASGKLLIRGRKANEKKVPTDGDAEEYLLHKKDIHGPYVNLHERLDISAGTFSGRHFSADKNHGAFFVFQDGVEIGTFSNIETTTDAAGTKYLLCNETRERGMSKIFVIDAHGRVGIYDEVKCDDRKAIIGRNATTKTSTVIYGGNIVCVHQNATSITHFPLKRNLVQLVRTKAPKDAAESESIYCNGVQVAGPYESIRNLELKENGKLSYIALWVDNHGVRKFLSCKSRIPAILLG